MNGQEVSAVPCLGVRVDGLHRLEVLVVQALAERAGRAPQLDGRAGHDLVGRWAGLRLLVLRQRDARVLLQQLLTVGSLRTSKPIDITASQ